MKTQLTWLWGMLMFFCLSGNVNAQQASSLQSDSSVVMRFRIFYPINESRIVEDYMDNAKSFHSIRKHLEKSPKIDSIVVYSYASPEGPYYLNKRLATERGKAAKQYLLSQFPSDRHFPDSLIVLNPTAENWEGLREKVYYQYPYDDAEEVLALLDRTNISDTRRKQLLKRLNGGKPWAYILKKIMPQLRYATWVSVWQSIKVEQAVKPVRDLKVELPPMNQPLYYIGFSPPEEKETKTILALKTNLLYDLVTALNVEVEVPIGNHWSVMIEDVFPWWEKDNKYCFQLWEMGVEGRYWFNDNKHHSHKLSGRFVGVYGMSGKYDFQWNRDLNYQGEFWSVGATYGYAFPIGKRFKLELSASVGYLSTAYRHYNPAPDYGELILDPYKQGRVGYFGPTKLKVSLVLPIKYTYKKSGGVL